MNLNKWIEFRGYTEDIAKDCKFSQLYITTMKYLQQATYEVK